MSTLIINISINEHLRHECSVCDSCLLLHRNASIRSHILSTASLQKALGSPSPGTNKKKDSKRRSSRKSDSATSSKTDQPTSQWYTTTEISQNTSTPVTPLLSSYPSTPIFELRQEVIFHYYLLLCVMVK